MPRQPARSYTEIYNVLVKKKIFLEDGTLKKERHSTDDNYQVWADAAKDLPPMTRHNVYTYVKDDRKLIQTNLRNHHFPELVALDQHTKSEGAKNSSDDHVIHSHCTDITSNVVAVDGPTTLSDYPDEYDDLLRMKMNILYDKFMQKIVLDPFLLTVYSPNQTAIYKDLVKNGACICLTVLQGVIRGIRLRSNFTDTINIISMSATYENNTIYIGHEMCQVMQTDAVAYFYEHFINSEDHIPLPTKICLQYNFEIIDEISIVVNEHSFVDYNNQYLEYLAENDEEKKKLLCVPSVIIIVDLVSILNTVNNSDILCKKLSAVKKFYLKCIILLSLKETLSDFKRAVGSVLTVLLSPHEDNNVVNERESLECQLKNIEVLSFYDDFVKYSSNKELMEALPICEKGMPTSDFILDLASKVRKNTSTEPNEYYSLTWYTSQFGSLLSIFLSWTRLSVDDSTHFDIATAPSVRHLNLIRSKKDCSKFSDFFAQHIMETNDSVNIGRSNLNNRKKRKVVSDVDLKYTKRSRFEENWKGRNKCYKEPLDLFSSKDNATEKDESKLDSNSLHHSLPKIHTGNGFEADAIKVSDSIDHFAENLTVYTAVLPEQNNSLDFSCSNKVDGFSKDNNKTSDSALASSSTFEHGQLAFHAEAHSSELSESNKGNINISEDFDEKIKPIANSSAAEQSIMLSENNHSTYRPDEEHNYSWTENTSKRDAASSNISVTSLDLFNYVEVIVPEEISKSKQDNDMRTEGKPSKFTGPCRDMDIRHEQIVKCRRKDSLLRNACKLNPRIIKGNTYAFSDSSKFDVITEILSFAYKNFFNFRNACDQKDMCLSSCKESCIIESIMRFCKSGSINSIQRDRCHLLYKHAVVNEITAEISIAEDLGSFFKKLMNAHPSYSLIIECPICKYTKIVHEHVMQLNINQSQSLKNIDGILSTFIKNSRLGSKCESCEHRGLKIDYIWHSYLFIDILNNGIDDFVDSSPYYLDLSTVPGVINRYALCGVISLESDGKFIAYCTNLDKFWNKRNGVKTKIQACISEKARLAYIQYIKIN